MRATWDGEDKHALDDLQRMEDPSCPRFVCVPTHQFAGLGHRLCNLQQGIMLSLFTGLPLAAATLEHGGRHGNYPGADDLIRFPTTVRCPDNVNNSGAPPSWSVVRPQVPPALLNGTGDLASGVMQLLPPKNSSCFTVFSFHEFWPSSYEAARPFLRAMLRPGSVTGQRLAAGLRYSPTRLNVALHGRVGDNVPTPPDLFPHILRNVLQRVVGCRGCSVPVAVWVFSEDPHNISSYIRPVLEQYGVADVHLDTANMSALETFWHLLSADVLITSDSSFSYVAAYLATKPVVLAAPKITGRRSFSGMPQEGHIRVRANGTFDDPSGRLARMADTWRRSAHGRLARFT